MYICMNNSLTMSAAFESRKNTQASMITAGFAAFMLLLMFLLKWSIPVIAHPPAEQGILVDLNLPDEELVPPARESGGGGGNPVQAAGPAGAAPYSPPNPGTDDDSRDVEDTKDEADPPVIKPDNPKPTATKINENKSVVKTEPKPNPQPPAPQQPKHVLQGRTLTGSGNGGGAAQDYDRSGGTGTGSGIGRGSGTGGGSGTGEGGGNGSGSGLGNGPRVTKGDRRIVSSYTFEGDLDKATIYAEIKVSQDGVGTLLGFAKGSTATSSSYRSAIVQYLRNIRFNKSDHESTVTVQFNFRVNG